MSKNNETKEVNIIKFVNIYDKNKRFTSIQDLVKEGLVTDYRFLYTKPTDKEENRYISKRIEKLDLYNGIITTVNGNRYKIVGKIKVNISKRD